MTARTNRGDGIRFSTASGGRGRIKAPYTMMVNRVMGSRVLSTAFAPWPH